MARNEMCFAAGNTVGVKLTQEIHDLFVNTIRITGRVSVAAGRCAIGISTARGWMAKGRLEEEGPYRKFLDDVERAKAEFLLLASKRLNQLALGGRVEMPAWDKNGNPVRDHREDCAAIPGVPCGCPLVLVEKVLLPESRILMWQCDRVDPAPSGDPQQPDVPMALEQTDAEQIAAAAQYFDLFRAGIQTLLDLGVPLPQIATPALAIETTATTVQAEPEPATEPATTVEPKPES